MATHEGYQVYCINPAKKYLEQFLVGWGVILSIYGLNHPKCLADKDSTSMLDSHRHRLHCKHA
jgi:hypothetical protein